MKVYYSSSIWGRGKGHLGLPKRINWQFEYAGLERRIPILYRFPEGIVFDVITLLDEVKLNEFIKKYEASQEKMTPLQRRSVEKEHPYQAITMKEIWINGRKIEKSYSSSGALGMPWVQQKDEMKDVKKAYSHLLKEDTAFACQRFCVPYPDTDSIIQKTLCFFRLNNINNIKLSTYPVQWFYPLDIHFEMTSKEDKLEISFNHPVTGTAHTLYFQNLEFVEIPFRAEGNRKIYTFRLEYEIEPDLPKGDTLQFNSGLQYTEPPKSEEGKFIPAAASSIGIIGGACGPTSIYVSKGGEEGKVPRGLHGLPLQVCFSIPSLKKGETASFVLEGINVKKFDGGEYSF